MARVIEVRKLLFMCDNELCMNRAAFEVTTQVDHEAFGPGTMINTYCEDHLPIKLKEVWRDLEMGY